MIIGNLGSDPEIRDSKGAKIVKFSVATSEEWMNKEAGKKFSRTDWHRVVVFNPQLVDITSKYLKKGSLVYIRGKLRPSSWVDDTGQKRTTVEIEMLDLKMFPRGEGFGEKYEDNGYSSDQYDDYASGNSGPYPHEDTGNGPNSHNTRDEQDIDIPF